MCGIVGIIGIENNHPQPGLAGLAPSRLEPLQEASREAFLSLTSLQHRGQDAAGILTYDSEGFHLVKNLGLVENVFKTDQFQYLTGSMAIGHTRYSTIGRGDLTDVQPFLINYPFGIGMVHNGNIINVKELAHELKVKKKRHLLTQSDTEILLNFLADGIAESQKESFGDPLNVDAGDITSPERFFEDLCFALKKIFKTIQGSYSIAALVADQGLVFFRDPYGLRPLLWGQKLEHASELTSQPKTVSHMVASESVALELNQYQNYRNVNPAEVVFIHKTGKIFSRILEAKEHRPCMFEWVYFASPETEIDRVPVYASRIELGKNLAEKVKLRMKTQGINPDIVVPVPDTSRTAAIALSEALLIPYREVLIKNRYIKRTFIMDSQKKRSHAMNIKLSPVPSEIKDKKVLLVDDSIVRGNTSKKIIELVRRAGAKEVYFVSTCPPIVNPCYYGIDFPTPSELIASGRSLEEIEKSLGADAVIYLDVEGLESSITQLIPDTVVEGKKIKKFKPCMACLDASYPTPITSAKDFELSRQRDRVSP